MGGKALLEGEALFAWETSPSTWGMALSPWEGVLLGEEAPLAWETPLSPWGIVLSPWEVVTGPKPGWMPNCLGTNAAFLGRVSAGFLRSSSVLGKVVACLWANYLGANATFWEGGDLDSWEAALSQGRWLPACEELANAQRVALVTGEASQVIFPSFFHSKLLNLFTCLLFTLWNLSSPTLSANPWHS